jgi:hypothetical protein
VLLSILGFYIGNASSYPRVQRVLAPSYVQAKAAIESLKRDGFLSPNQAGFQALAILVEGRIADQNKSVPRPAIVLDRLETTGGGIAFGPATSRQTVGLRMNLRGQAEPLQWDLLELSEAVEESWKARSLTWATWLFWSGIVQTVWPLLMDTKPK